jgi:hypothetical protein
MGLVAGRPISLNPPAIAHLQAWTVRIALQQKLHGVPATIPDINISGGGLCR